MISALNHLNTINLSRVIFRDIYSNTRLGHFIALPAISECLYDQAIQPFLMIWATFANRPIPKAFYDTCGFLQRFGVFSNGPSFYLEWLGWLELPSNLTHAVCI